MNLTKCSKGHYYDGDKFSTCPFCSGAGASSAGDSVTVAMPSGSSSPDVTMSLSSGPSSEPVTMAGSSYSANDPVTQKSSYTGMPEASLTGGSSFNSGGSSFSSGSVLPSDDAVTITHYAPIMEESVVTEPVVGWLVCTAGKYFGRSFPLKAGRNFVGRNPQMDVCLEEELSVSRERHAVIIYEPRGRMFLAQPGDSRELFYLNDKVVLDNERLKPYDLLSIGKVNMMLIPFCTETFAWEDLENKDEKKKDEKKTAGISGLNETKESK